MKDLSEYKRNLRQTRICAKCGKPFVPHTPSAKYCDDCNTGGYVERNLKGENYEPTRVTTKLGHRLEEAKRYLSPPKRVPKRQCPTLTRLDDDEDADEDA